MTEDPERELTPVEDARIRSLLASARASEEAPDYVAARLDSVLADLAIDRAIDRADDRTADRVAGDHAAGSRPWWRRGRVLLAAAVGVGVVSLAAVSLPQLSGQQGSGGSGDKTTSTTQGKSGPEADQQSLGTRGQTSRLGTDTFRRDVRRLLAASADSRQLAPSSGVEGRTGDELASGACPASPEAGVVRSREVLLDGKLALLEVFGVRDGARVVRAVSCDGKQTLASARIPAD
jgi:hypothetical protein